MHAAQEMLGDVLAPIEPARSLEVYKRAVQLHRDRADAVKLEGSVASPIPVPPRLLNNTAVLYHRAGQSHVAQELLQEAMASLESGTALS